MDDRFQSLDPTYHAQVDPITADKRARVIPRSNIRRLVVPLDVAGNALPFRLRGDFLYVDNNATGVVTCQLNNTSEDPFPLLAQAGLVDMPFEDIYLTWAAQPGKILNLWYGYRARFLSPSQNIATIGSITNAVNVQGPRGMFGAPVLADQPVLSEDLGFAYGASYASNTLIAAGATSQLFAAASNVNGAIIWQASITTRSAADSFVGLLAKATAPATIIDGDLLYHIAQAASTASNPRTGRSIRVASGKGVWFFSQALETIAIRDCLYNLL